MNFGEECDEGDKGGPCCDENCKLKSNANCSVTQLNAFCCDLNCQIRPKNQECMPQDLRYCLERSLCDGHTHVCPMAKSMADGSTCYNNGFCMNGTCQPCKDQCQCQKQCYRCCRNEAGNCVAINPVPDESICWYADNVPGRCFRGQCTKLKFSIDITTTEAPPIPKSQVNWHKLINRNFKFECFLNETNFFFQFKKISINNCFKFHGVGHNCSCCILSNPIYNIRGC